MLALPGATGADVTATVEGLFWGGGMDQFWSQLIGSAFVTAFVLVIGFA